MPIYTSPSRERLNTAQAERIEGLIKREKGDLAPIAEVEAKWAGIVVDIRTRLLAIPPRMAARYPGNKKLIDDLQHEIEQALHDIANDDV